MPAVVHNKHALALHLHMTVGELERTMTVDEFRGWQQYFIEESRKREFRS